MIGILDWELSTIGHPYSDLANLLNPYYVPAIAGSPMGGLRGISAAELPIPPVNVLLERYCQQTGRPFPIKNWMFCIAFSFFRVSPSSHVVCLYLSNMMRRSLSSLNTDCVFFVFVFLVVRHSSWYQGACGAWTGKLGRGQGVRRASRVCCRAGSGYFPRGGAGEVQVVVRGQWLFIHVSRVECVVRSQIKKRTESTMV